jgi:hypothetical protein
VAGFADLGVEGSHDRGEGGGGNNHSLTPHHPVFNWECGQFPNCHTLT